MLLLLLLFKRSADRALKPDQGWLSTEHDSPHSPLFVPPQLRHPLELDVGVEAARAGAAGRAPGRGWSGPGVVVGVVVSTGAPAVLTGAVLLL